MKKLLSFALIFVLFVSAGYAKNLSEYDTNLINLLNDENIGVRSSAAQLLGERKVEDAVKPLVKMLKTEKSYKARIVAAIALHKIGDAESLPALKKVAKNDRNKTVRRVVTGLVQDFENSTFAKM
ncbi:hypothetical protein B6I21_08120 [candidate division KSB1 bacterium 4572_119]|nr:MAG: hypothetical protein B6I21_08120 [candidate division KSB1 bacterium 4572_119]